MDLYTQIQDKLHDLSKRFAHEARYFQERAPLGVDEEDASAPQRLPLTEQPFSETKETLGLRAGCAARCIMALNEQLDMLLSSLPADEGDEEGLDKVLEELCRENIRAGEELNIEAEKGEKLLKEMRDALHRMCPAPTVIPPEVRLPKLDKAGEGAAKGAGDASAGDDTMDMQ